MSYYNCYVMTRGIAGGNVAFSQATVAFVRDEHLNQIVIRCGKKYSWTESEDGNPEEEASEDEQESIATVRLTGRSCNTWELSGLDKTKYENETSKTLKDDYKAYRLTIDEFQISKSGSCGDDVDTGLDATIIERLHQFNDNFDRQFFCGRMSLKWDNKEQVWKEPPFDFEPVRLGRLGSENAIVMQDKIRRGQDITVFFKKAQNDKSFVDDLTGMRDLSAWLGSVTDGWSDAGQLRNALLANAPSLLTTCDLLGDVAQDDSSHLESILAGLNESQQAAFRLVRKAPAGFVLCQGPPGTGKTTFILALLRILLQDTKRHKVIVMAPSNNGVNELATKIHNDCIVVVPNNSKFVVRLHALETERGLFLREVRNKRKRSRATQTTRLGSSERVGRLLEQLEGAYFMADDADQLDDGNAQSNEGDKDKRVQHERLSVGHRMLEYASIIEGGPNHPDNNAFADLKELLKEFGNGVDFTDQKLRVLNQGIDDLFFQTLQAADVVVGTPDLLQDEAVVKACGNDTEFLVFDEACRMTEPQTIPLFAAYRHAKGKVMVGDFHQLRPHIDTQVYKAKPCYLSHLEVSLMERLCRAGYQSASLNVQYRMAPEIAAPSNALVYKNRLINDPSVERAQRPKTQAFVRWLDKKFRHIVRRESPIDIPVAYLDITSENAITKKEGESRYNDAYLANGILLAKQIVDAIAGDQEPDFTVMYLASYGAQVDAIRVALQRLTEENAKYSCISTATVGTCQGLEFDFGIFDLLPFQYPRGDVSPGFMSQYNRTNVATTRFKHGLIIQANHDLVSKTPPDHHEDEVDGNWLLDYHKKYEQYRVPIRGYIQPCTYWTEWDRRAREADSAR